MRRIPLLIGLALVFSSLAVAAQEPSGVPYITVSGFAEDWVDPDVAVWAIRITNDGKDLRELKQTSTAARANSAIFG